MNHGDHDDELATLFLEESAENIELLTTSLLELERRPGDPVRVQDAFRAAHSLKGMAAAMGHTPLARVLHALEDILGDVREQVVAATPSVITQLLVSVDLCGSMLASIAATGEGDADVDAHVASIEEQRAELRGGTQAVGVRSPHAPSADVVEAVAAAGLELFVVVVHPEESSLMPAARAYAALLQAQRIGDVLASDPVLSELEQGSLPAHALRMWVATERTIDDVVMELGSCPEIRTVEVVESAPDSRDADRAAVQAALPAGEPAVDGPRKRQPGTAADAASLSVGRTVRVESARLDALMHGIGELLVQRARLESVARLRHDAELREVIEDLTRAATDMQAMVMDVRMVAIDVVFRRLPRLVRDLEQALDRKVNLVLSGAHTELDRTVIELLGDPLVHLVRNAVDHGIEPPEERRAAGKPEHGTLAISAAAVGATVLLRVRDDGRGIQPDVVRERALARNVVSRAELDAMTDEQALQLCFAPGFSTRSEVTDLSGRGVGLDVVRSSVRSLGGDVVIDTGEDGTVMTIRLPLTLAIVPVLLVQVGSDRYALPITRVRTTLEVGDDVLRTVANRPMVLWGEELVPVIRLGTLLEMDEGPDVDEEHVVLVEGSEGLVGIQVDRVLTQEEVVTRPVPGVVTASGFLSASAMLGDGDIAFLIDTDAVSATARKDGLHAARLS